MIRQGDVLLKPIQSLPKGLAKQEPGKLILAYGEVTGHAHEIKERTSVTAWVDDKGSLFLDVEEPTTLTHQEHDEVVIAPGKYQVIRQREYTPEEIRNVAD
jgi:hypothetical protein